MCVFIRNDVVLKKQDFIILSPNIVSFVEKFVLLSLQ